MRGGLAGSLELQEPLVGGGGAGGGAGGGTGGGGGARAGGGDREPLLGPPPPVGGGGAGGGDGGGGLLRAEERYSREAVRDLDRFFTRILRYHSEKGFAVIVTSRVLNLLTLAFTVLFTAALLLLVDWGVLLSDCPEDAGGGEHCELAAMGVLARPFRSNSPFYNVLVCIYLTLASLYWGWNVVHFCLDYRELGAVRDFVNRRLGVSDRELQYMSWPELVQRLERVQASHQLCIHRDLNAHDIVARIMRKENYVIGMLNMGVLGLHLPLPGLRRRVLLTKTLEWNLYFCIFDFMFDESFRIRRGFKDVRALEARFRLVGAANLVVAPFTLVFMLSYFFLRNAEKCYRHPGTIGARGWSPYARWKMREFNEVPQQLNLRLDNSSESASKYVAQFQVPILTQCAKFVAYIAGSFTATLLMVGLVDESLLQRNLLGQNLLWWLAVFGIFLASSRAFIPEVVPVFDPEFRMAEVVRWSHFMPRHWRGRCHTQSVLSEFQRLFQYKLVLFLEEVFSIFFTPLVLFFSMPNCAHRIIDFVEEFTTEVEGVGAVCSLSLFNFQDHGNSKYGAPSHAPKGQRTAQGKMEKSFLSFCKLYPQWEPDELGQSMLDNLERFGDTIASSSVLPESARGGGGGHAYGAGRGAPWRSAQRGGVPAGAPPGGLRRRGGGLWLGGPQGGAAGEEGARTTARSSLHDREAADSQFLLQRYYTEQLRSALQGGALGVETDAAYPPGAVGPGATGTGLGVTAPPAGSAPVPATATPMINGGDGGTAAGSGAHGGPVGASPGSLDPLGVGSPVPDITLDH